MLIETEHWVRVARLSQATANGIHELHTLFRHVSGHIDRRLLEHDARRLVLENFIIHHVGHNKPLQLL